MGAFGYRWTRTHLDIERVDLSASNMAERALSRLWRCRPDPPPCAGSKSFSPRFKMTGRAVAFPMLESKGDYDFANDQVGMNVREFGPIEPTIFVTGRILLVVPFSSAGSVEIWRMFWLF
jgi:hypothetical protein